MKKKILIIITIFISINNVFSDDKIKSNFSKNIDKNIIKKEEIKDIDKDTIKEEGILDLKLNNNSKEEELLLFDCIKKYKTENVNYLKKIKTNLLKENEKVESNYAMLSRYSKEYSEKLFSTCNVFLDNYYISITNEVVINRESEIYLELKQDIFNIERILTN